MANVRRVEWKHGASRYTGRRRARSRGSSGAPRSAPQPVVDQRDFAQLTDLVVRERPLRSGWTVIEQAPAALIGMMKGEAIGKRLVQVGAA